MANYFGKTHFQAKKHPALTAITACLRQYWGFHPQIGLKNMP